MAGKSSAPERTAPRSSLNKNIGGKSFKRPAARKEVQLIREEGSDANSVDT